MSGTFGKRTQYPRPSGNDKMRALRMLRTHRPDLYVRVLAGEMSPHAAMVQAGFRHKTMTVPIDDMFTLALSLRRRLTADDREELVYWLTANGDELQRSAEGGA